MDTLHTQLPQEIKLLVAEYNTNSKLGTFLYNNPDCNELIRTKFGRDYWFTVTRCNQIKNRLAPVVHRLYHGKDVVVKDRCGNYINGIVKHDLTRKYTASDGTEHTVTNDAAFRGINDGNALDEQTIALWVETGDKYTTHLYTADRIELVGEPASILSVEEGLANQQILKEEGEQSVLENSTKQ